MKKFLTVLLVGAALFSFPLTSVFAEDNEITEIVTSKEGSVTLTATQASAYSVQLPKTVDVSSGSATITLKAKGDVDSAYQIIVSVKNGATKKLVDKADSNHTIDLTVTTGDAIDGADVPSNNYSDDAKTEITITHDGLTAGTYSYELPLVIALQAITA